MWNWYQLFFTDGFFVSQSYFTNHWHICWTRWLSNDCYSVQLHMIVFILNFCHSEEKYEETTLFYFIFFVLIYFLYESVIFIAFFIRCMFVHVYGGCFLPDSLLVTAWNGTCSFRFPDCGPDRWTNPTLEKVPQEVKLTLLLKPAVFGLVILKLLFFLNRGPGCSFIVFI